MTYRMLVVDVDGTLMGRDARVTSRVRAAIGAALEAGVVVTLATGRWFRSAQAIAADLALDGPIILHNGALVKDCHTGKVVDHCHMPRALAEEAIAIICRHGLQPIVYGNAFEGELVMAGPAAGDSAASARYLSGKVEHLRRLALGELRLIADPLQLAVVDEAHRADPLLAHLADVRWRTVTSMTLAAPDARFVEVLNASCSKAAAIGRLCERLGISSEQVMAVGDNFNDLDMIAAAGLGVAMGNAPRGVQAAADWVAPSVETDGLAVAIERFVLRDGPHPVPEEEGTITSRSWRVAAAGS